jgi:tetratricopeptide (TPR) repeat protein
MKSMPHWLTLGAMVLLIGCGSNQMPASQVRNAVVSYSEAVEAQREGDYATALSLYNAAIDEGGLDSDQHADALLRSAECCIELGNLDDAAAALDLLEANAPELEQFYLIRCKLYARQGDSAKAQAAYEAAREINPTAEPPVKL